MCGFEGICKCWQALGWWIKEECMIISGPCNRTNTLTSYFVCVCVTGGIGTNPVIYKCTALWIFIFILWVQSRGILAIAPCYYYWLTW